MSNLTTGVYPAPVSRYACTTRWHGTVMRGSHRLAICTHRHHQIRLARKCGDRIRTTALPEHWLRWLAVQEDPL